jgi:hypothetical protein
MPRPTAERPTAEQVGALLTAAGISAYEAAKLTGGAVSERSIQRAKIGKQNLSEVAWLALCVTLTQQARDQLPAALVRRVPVSEDY